MKVTLRKRNQGGKTNLYLDYCHKGKRKTENLKLYYTDIGSPFFCLIETVQKIFFSRLKGKKIV
jgi:hypothetical protein